MSPGPNWLFRHPPAPPAEREAARVPPVRSAPSLLSRIARFLAFDIVVRLRQLLRLALLVVEAMVALRIVLKVTGANAQAGFSSFVYRVSSPFVEPFHPVFADQSVNQHPFEVGSLLAMVVYAALAYLAVRVVRIILSPRA